jgi:hypothetical protein
MSCRDHCRLCDRCPYFDSTSGRCLLLLLCMSMLVLVLFSSCMWLCFVCSLLLGRFLFLFFSYSRLPLPLFLPLSIPRFSVSPYGSYSSSPSSYLRIVSWPMSVRLFVAVVVARVVVVAFIELISSSCLWLPGCCCCRARLAA